MPIDNPSTLVEEFKKTGEFDRLRRELLAQFLRDDSFSEFKNRIEDIARQRLTSDQMLHYLPPDLVHKELRQEVERFPVVERAVADVRILSDPSFLASIQTSVQKILLENGGTSTTIAKDAESVKPRPPVTEYSADHLEKTIHDTQVSGTSKPSGSMVTGVPMNSGPSMQSPGSFTSTTSLLTTAPPQEDEVRDTNIRNPNAGSTQISRSTPQIDAKILKNDADVEMKDI